MSGAIDVFACPTRTLKFNNCRCEFCAVCGYRKHTSVHGAVNGQPPGSKPWGHEFQPRDESPCYSYARVCGYPPARQT